MNFPINSLPSEVQDAVQAAHALTGVPIEAIASTALSIMSYAVQGHYDVQTIYALQGRVPTSLYTLTIFESGGGKTTVFNLLNRGYNKWLANAIDTYDDTKAAYDVDLEVWEQERASIKSDKTISGDLKRKNLANHDSAKPINPPNPDSHFKTFTTAGLIEQLKMVRPSVGFFTSEAGELFKSYSAGSTTGGEIELFAQLTNLWDGGVVKKSTLSGGNTHIKNRRAAANFMVQGEVAKDFFNHRTLSGQGIHARILVARVPSIQKLPLDLSAEGQAKQAACERRLDAFAAHIENWCRRPLPVNPDDPYRLEPDLLKFSNLSNSNPLLQWNNNVAMHRSGYHNQGVESFMQRQLENATRIAGVMAAYNGETEISDATCADAVEIIEYYVAQRETLDLGQGASRHNDLIEPTKYLQSFFAKQKAKGITDFSFRDVRMNARASIFRDLNIDVQTKILNSLVTSGELELDTLTNGSGRSVQKYVYAL